MNAEKIDAIVKSYEPILGAWYIDGFIGAGGFGRVYRIKKEELSVTTYSALKYLSVPQDEEELQQLHSEGQSDKEIADFFESLARGINEENLIMSSLKGNTNIVSYEDSRAIPKKDGLGYDIFIRMELLKSLTAQFMEKPPSNEEVIKIGIDICSALEMCEKVNIIHRDIKLGNIFVNENGDYKLGDFGIARRLDATAGFMSKKGTFNYMAPEVYKGDMYDSRVDIYSLGIVLYRLLNNNRLPFYPPYPTPIKPSDKEQALVSRMKGTPIPLPCNAQDALGALVLKACAYNPNDRFLSAGEMRQAFMELLTPAQEIYPQFDNNTWCPPQYDNNLINNEFYLSGYNNFYNANHPNLSNSDSGNYPDFNSSDSGNYPNFNSSDSDNYPNFNSSDSDNYPNFNSSDSGNYPNFNSSDSDNYPLEYNNYLDGMDNYGIDNNPDYAPVMPNNPADPYNYNVNAGNIYPSNKSVFMPTPRTRSHILLLLFITAVISLVAAAILIFFGLFNIAILSVCLSIAAVILAIVKKF